MLLCKPFFTSVILTGIFVSRRFAASNTGCECPEGCNSTCYDNTCTIENAAVGKVANASTVYETFGPCLAVDEITDVDNCMETAQGDLNPFWRVDLGQEFIVHFMTVYRRWGWSSRMEGLKIYVDKQLCDVIEKHEREGNPSSGKSGSPVPIIVTCSTPLTGRYVTLVKNATNGGSPEYLETLSVCEVQVWGSTTSSSTSATTATTTTTTSTANTTPIQETTETTVTTSLTPSMMTTPKDSVASTGSPDSEQQAASLTVYVIGGVLGALVAFNVAVVVIVFVKRRKRRRDSNPVIPTAEAEDRGANVTSTTTVPAEEDLVYQNCAKTGSIDTRHASAKGNRDYPTSTERGIYDPLSHEDSKCSDDNAAYSDLVFADRDGEKEMEDAHSEDNAAYCNIGDI